MILQLLEYYQQTIECDEAGESNTYLSLHGLLNFGTDNVEVYL